jgi:hypothetical protein
LNLRNKLWTAWKHFPFLHALSFGLSRSAVALARSIRYGYPDLVAKALWQGVFPPNRIRSKRNPMTPAEWTNFQKEREGKPIEIAGTDFGVDDSPGV